MGLRDYPKRVEGSGIRYKIRELKWQLYYAWQRAWRGYDEEDLFAINDKFIERNKVVLKWLYENHHSYPGIITEEEWEQILEKMLYHLDFMEEDWESENTDFEAEWKSMRYHTSQFFKLYGEWFYNLDD